MHSNALWIRGVLGLALKEYVAAPCPNWKEPALTDMAYPVNKAYTTPVFLCYRRFHIRQSVNTLGKCQGRQLHV
jgi:hypothetical protein